MFRAFTTLNNLRPTKTTVATVGGRTYAKTVFSDSSARCVSVRSVGPGRRGNGYVANLYKINATKYRFRLWAPDGTRLNTVTQEDATPPSTVIAQLVELVNNNATFKKYIRVAFKSESTEAFSASTDMADGQTLTGGR
jgi:hypothetical protein